MLLLSGIKKYYSGQLILTIPSMSLANGIFWIRGANGSGKTTLLKIIAGLLPFEGTIRLNDAFDSKENPVDYRRHVNYAEAEPQFPSFLSGHDLINLFKRTKNGDERDVSHLLDAFHIHSFLDNPVGTYSSGMVKKISLVLAFIGKPKIILLDEPLVTLDDHSIPILLSLISSYFTERNVSFLITSHQPLGQDIFLNVHHILVKEKTICFQ